MLQETQRMSAPSAASVSIRTAVWIVICREPAMRAPFRGCLGPYSSRVAIRPGISVSASEISLRPNSARPMSFTMYSDAGLAVMTIPDVEMEKQARAEGPFRGVAIAGGGGGGKKDIRISLYVIQAAPAPHHCAAARRP